MNEIRYLILVLPPWFYPPLRGSNAKYAGNKKLTRAEMAVKETMIAIRAASFFECLWSLRTYIRFFEYAASMLAPQG
jgi:hypothetical protein